MGKAKMETRYRSMAKAVTYRLLGSTSTGLIFYAFTGRAAASAGAGLADLVIKIGVYFLHERIWERINFGRSAARPPEYEI